MTKRTNFPEFWDEHKALEFFANSGQEELEEMFILTAAALKSRMKKWFPTKTDKESVLKVAKSILAEEGTLTLVVVAEKEVEITDDVLRTHLGDSVLTRRKFLKTLTEEQVERFNQLYRESELAKL